MSGCRLNASPSVFPFRIYQRRTYLLFVGAFFLEINCGPLGVLHNGWMENSESGTGLGASIIFRCDEGMMMVGNASTVCQIDGTWRYPPPLCLGNCDDLPEWLGSLGFDNSE